MPQRHFKSKLIGKNLRNLESTTQETRNDEKEPRRKTEDNSFTFTVKADNVRGGSVIPNRIFVGGISVSTTEWDIRSRFAEYGNIRAVKILRDMNGISRGYGFVTFDTEEEARATLENREIIFKGRKLNIAPAIKKQNLLSDRTFPTESCNAVNYGGVYEDQGTRYKGYDGQIGYTGYEAIENPRIQMDNGMSQSEAILQSPECGNAQMNFMPCPTWVYIPQQPYPGMSINYPINGNIVEMIQVLPAPLCFSNGELE